MNTTYGSLPFREQIEFFRRKLNVPTQTWTDIYSQEHDWAFVVAGADRNDLVAAFRTAVDKAIAGGGTLESFRNDFDRIVRDFGWDYNGGRNWRSRVIYETNLFSSYSAGRYAQLVAGNFPYWQYHHSGAEHPRPEHLAWDNLVLPSGDPWWGTHFPINAWGCQCSVSGLTEYDVKALGLNIDTAPAVELETRQIGQRSPGGPRTVQVPRGIDPGFEYTPGKGRLESAIPPPLENGPPGSSGVPGVPPTRPTDPLPPVRPFDAGQILPNDLTEEAYAEAFLQAFGATLDQPAIFRDVIGEALVIGRALFVTRRTGQLKADKYRRGKFMLLLAHALKAPDEIWVRLEYQHARDEVTVRRRYIARFDVAGHEVPALAVFEWGTDGWSGITVFSPDQHDPDDLRIGVRVYRREE